MMIDLGIDLANYDEPPAKVIHQQPKPAPVPGGGYRLPLDDLQRAGFVRRPVANNPNDDIVQD